MKTLLIFFVRIYQVCISPMLHFLAGPFAGCRFQPTCSQYFIDAVRANGAIKGAALGVWRVCRCNPFGKHGYDPPPGWEEYVEKNPSAAYIGRRPCDLPDGEPPADSEESESNTNKKN